MQSLVADGEVWGSYDKIPGLALCPVPSAALTLPAKRNASLAQTVENPVGDAGTVWLPCMGPPNPALLGIPVNPTTAVGVALTLRGLRVCLPPDFERKLLLVMTANREIELGVRVSIGIE